MEAIQEKNHLIHVLQETKGLERELVVWYFLVISVQKPVKLIFEFLTRETKSHPISSAIQVDVERKKSPSWDPQYCT
jgi:hypothetical protein